MHGGRGHIPHCGFAGFAVEIANGLSGEATRRAEELAKLGCNE